MNKIVLAGLAVLALAGVGCNSSDSGSAGGSSTVISCDISGSNLCIDYVGSVYAASPQSESGNCATSSGTYSTSASCATRKAGSTLNGVCTLYGGTSTEVHYNFYGTSGTCPGQKTVCTGTYSGAWSGGC